MRATTLHETGKLRILERQGWEFVERKQGKEAVAVLALTDDGNVILTEQERRPVGKRVIDFPAGLVGDKDENDDPAQTAKRELEEETGFACDSVERVARGPSSPGITSEIVSLYRARGLRRRGKGGGVENETITVHEVPLSGIAEWLEARENEGLLIDLKIWSGLYWLTL